MILPSGLIVPWITPWSNEVIPAHATILRPGYDGVRYIDQSKQDTAMGVLWTREHNRQGSGDPLWSKVHAGRQRQAMLERRCQVCGEHLPPTNIPWLTPIKEWNETVAEGHENLPQLSCTNNPPTCEACWPIAEQRCPHLRAQGFMRFYVERMRPWGILGDIYHPLVKERGLWVSFDQRKALPHMVARQLLVQLMGIIPAEDYVPPHLSREDPRSAAYKKQTGRKIMTDNQWRRYRKKERRKRKETPS